MAVKFTDTQHYSDIADAIRAKGGTSDTYTPAQMPQAIEDLPSGGAGVLGDLLAGTATGDIVIPDVESLFATTIFFSGNGALSCNKDVTSLSMPDLITADTQDGTTKLGGFKWDSSSAYGLKLKRLDLPKCKSLNLWNNNFSYWYASFNTLETFNAPEVERFIGSLRGAQITELIMPKLITLDNASGSSFFRECNKLITADLGQVTTIKDYAFSNDFAMDALVLRVNYMACVLTSTGAFAGTHIDVGGTGYVYVPRALISTYEAATNWSSLAGQFRALEDYTDDGTINGKFIHP